MHVIGNFSEFLRSEIGNFSATSILNWNWTYLKLWHRNSLLPMKSGNQGEGGGCARGLSMNTRLLVGPQDIIFWQQDHLP